MFIFPCSADHEEVAKSDDHTNMKYKTGMSKLSAMCSSENHAVQQYTVVRMLLSPVVSFSCSQTEGLRVIDIISSPKNPGME